MDITTDRPPSNDGHLFVSGVNASGVPILTGISSCHTAYGLLNANLNTESESFLGVDENDASTDFGPSNTVISGITPNGYPVNQGIYRPSPLDELSDFQRTLLSPVAESPAPVLPKKSDTPALQENTPPLERRRGDVKHQNYGSDEEEEEEEEEEDADFTIHRHPLLISSTGVEGGRDVEIEKQKLQAEIQELEMRTQELVNDPADPQTQVFTPLCEDYPITPAEEHTTDAAGGYQSFGFPKDVPQPDHVQGVEVTELNLVPDHAIRHSEGFPDLANLENKTQELGERFDHKVPEFQENNGDDGETPAAEENVGAKISGAIHDTKDKISSALPEFQFGGKELEGMGLGEQVKDSVHESAEKASEAFDVAREKVSEAGHGISEKIHEIQPPNFHHSVEEAEKHDIKFDDYEKEEKEPVEGFDTHAKDSEFGAMMSKTGDDAQQKADFVMEPFEGWPAHFHQTSGTAGDNITETNSSIQENAPDLFGATEKPYDPGEAAKEIVSESEASFKDAAHDAGKSVSESASDAKDKLIDFEQRFEKDSKEAAENLGAKFFDAKHSVDSWIEDHKPSNDSQEKGANESQKESAFHKIADVGATAKEKISDGLEKAETAISAAAHSAKEKIENTFDHSPNDSPVFAKMSDSGVGAEAFGLTDDSQPPPTDTKLQSEIAKVSGEISEQMEVMSFGSNEYQPENASNVSLKSVPISSAEKSESGPNNISEQSSDSSTKNAALSAAKKTAEQVYAKASDFGHCGVKTSLLGSEDNGNQDMPAVEVPREPNPTPIEVRKASDPHRDIPLADEVEPEVKLPKSRASITTSETTRSEVAKRNNNTVKLSDRIRKFCTLL